MDMNGHETSVRPWDVERGCRTPPLKCNEGGTGRSSPTSDWSSQVVTVPLAAQEWTATSGRCRWLAALANLCAFVFIACTGPVSAAPDLLRFSVTEGAAENHFYRCGPVAAHVIVSSGSLPRVLVAFPAGNTGVALWLDNERAPVSLGLAPGSQVEAVERADGMRGVAVRLHARTSALSLKSALLANIRTIREYIGAGLKDVPGEFAAGRDDDPQLVFRRTTLDGRHHVELRLEPSEGGRIAVHPDREGDVRLLAGPAGHVAFTIIALADDPPLVPFAADALFTPAVANRSLDRQVFAFLASEEKFAAGSWRFLTYFGRDTLLSLQLLMPVLQPPVIEAALGSVLERLAPDGDVAHEEAIGEFAVVENKKLSPPPVDLRRPVLDYNMVDSAYLLAPAAAAYLLDTPAAAARARAFLARTTADGERYDARLRKNLVLVLARAAPFMADARVENLVALKDELPVGNWRDSEAGLGGGRYAYDINAALVPAALRAAARLYRSGLLSNSGSSLTAASAGDAMRADPPAGAPGYRGTQPGLLGDNSARAAQAERAAEAWQTAARFFRVDVPAERAKALVADYAASLSLDPAAAVASINSGAPVSFHAVSLDAGGRPVPVMNTDEAFLLFFGEPAPEVLDAIATQITRPFPAGLRTAVGVVVANPAYADARVRRQFSRADYHGTVVWSWQQALLAAGLKRQLARTDLPAATRGRLAAAEKALWDVITTMQAQSVGELWTWEPRDGHEVFAPFGQSAGHADESNAAQLWSTVYLAVQPPRR